jgi:1,4-dihydroxy-2-naphthoyl-CoA hydrolase
MTTFDTDLLHKSMPLCATLGMRVDAADPSTVQLSMDWATERCTSGGLLHGGALMALADSAGGMCAFLNLPEGAGTSTIESKTNFLGAVKDGTVTASARPLHVGSATIVVETEVRRADRKLVGKVTQTQAVLKR